MKDGGNFRVYVLIFLLSASLFYRDIYKDIYRDILRCINISDIMLFDSCPPHSSVF